MPVKITAMPRSLKALAVCSNIKLAAGLKPRCGVAVESQMAELTAGGQVHVVRGDKTGAIGEELAVLGQFDFEGGLVVEPVGQIAGKTFGHVLGDKDWQGKVCRQLAKDCSQ